MSIQYWSTRNLRPVGPDTDDFVSTLAEEIRHYGGETRIYEYKTGSELNGWIVPPAWEVKEANLGWSKNRIVPGRLGVWSLSPSVDKEVGRKELQDHVLTHPRGTPWHWKAYYSPEETDWGFCFSDSEWATIPNRDERRYHVHIETETRESSMLALEWTLEGEKETNILLNAHNCHPYQMNDNLSGCWVAIETMKHLATKKNRFTYTLLICPELLGTVFWAKENAHRIRRAILLKAVGNPGQLKSQQPFDDPHLSFFLGEIAKPHPYRTLYGNDEIVLEPLGIPTGTLTRYPFPNYHTDMDRFVARESLTDTMDALLWVLGAMEADKRMYRRSPGVPRLSHHGLYYPPEHQLHYLASVAPLYWRGSHISRLAVDCKLSYDVVRDYVEGAESEGLLDLR